MRNSILVDCTTRKVGTLGALENAAGIIWTCELDHSSSLQEGRTARHRAPALTCATNAISYATSVTIFRAVNTTHPVQRGGELSSDQTIISLALGTTTSNRRY